MGSNGLINLMQLAANVIVSSRTKANNSRTLALKIYELIIIYVYGIPGIVILR